MKAVPLPSSFGVGPDHALHDRRRVVAHLRLRQHATVTALLAHDWEQVDPDFTADTQPSMDGYQTVPGVGMAMPRYRNAAGSDHRPARRSRPDSGIGRDLLAAFDGVQEGRGEAAADRRDVGSSTPMKASISLASHACSKSLTMPARVIVQASAGYVRARLPIPLEVRPLGEDRCTFEPGSDHPELLALYLGMLDADFTIVDSPELVEALRRLMGRSQRAIDAGGQDQGRSVGGAQRPTHYQRPPPRATSQTVRRMTLTSSQSDQFSM
jgi:hypothetical protein